MVKLEIGLLSDHLHRHHDAITFKTMGLRSLFLLIADVMAEFHQHSVLIDMVPFTAAMLRNGLIITVYIFFFQKYHFRHI